MIARKTLLLSCLLALATPVWGTLVCFTTLKAVIPWAKLDPELDRLFSANGITDFHTAWRHLARGRNFQSFLSYRGYTPDQVGESRRVEVVNFYFRDFFSQLRGDLLTFAQDECLTGALKSHGISPREDHVTSRQTLEAASHANRDRLLSEGGPVAAAVETEAGAIVNSLNLYPVHNTHQLSEVDATTPVLSSKEIRRAGLRGGVNSQEEFNRKFLRSDDQVFFHANFSRSPEKAVVPDAVYGNNGLVLKTPYAKAAGWVSVYLMYPEELQDFAQKECPDLVAKLDKETFTKLRRGDESIPTDDLSTLKEIRRRLGAFDFTTEDYAVVVKKLLLASLSELRAKDFAEYGWQLKALQSDDPRVIDTAVRTLVFARYKMPERFEVKVPTAVPGSEITTVVLPK